LLRLTATVKWNLVQIEYAILIAAEQHGFPIGRDIGTPKANGLHELLDGVLAGRNPLRNRTRQ